MSFDDIADPGVHLVPANHADSGSALGARIIGYI
jgi:hypothetical protein